MDISGDAPAESASWGPIIGLANSLPKTRLETIVIEAIYRHRYLRDVAELRHAECRQIIEHDDASRPAREAYVRAMIDMHAQQSILSTLLGVLGYVPEMPAE
ncbi:transcriptional repressor TraM [Bosea sp. MMO-172]|uniref:transcriptional repressor TraM n=1 Tax=Bosea sp. MMO-172 TaxID=3127885 RepID=UPI00301AFB29